MNRVLTRAEKASHDIRYNLLDDNGLASMPHPPTQRVYRFRNDNGKNRNDRHQSNPQLLAAANDLIVQAQRTWADLDSGNAYCEVPATDAGLIAMRHLISEGINVRVTKLFGLHRYRQVLQAYIEGMEARLALGKPVRHIASIANLSAGSVDALANPILEKIIAQDSEPADLAEQIQGNIANAINTLAHQINRETFRSERFQRLAKRGVRGQCLFVSCDHCGALASAADYVDYAQWILQCLPELGIDIDAIARQLEDTGVDACACKPVESEIHKMIDVPSHFTNSTERPLG